MDLKMPVMDGYEATRQIRASKAPGCDKIPIIAMTASALSQDAKHAKAAGMNGHIAKPFDVVDIERALLDVRITV
jgi:CheY-like chemotaxis protein